MVVGAGLAGVELASTLAERLPHGSVQIVDTGKFSVRCPQCCSVLHLVSIHHYPDFHSDFLDLISLAASAHHNEVMKPWI